MKRAILGGAWISATGWGTLSGGEKPHFATAAPVLPDHNSILPRVPSRYGRFDLFSRTGLLCATMALRDAGASLEEEFRPWGIVFSSTLESGATDMAFWDSTLEEDGAFAGPQLFSYTLPGTVGGELAILYRFTGPVLSTGQKPGAAGASALETASILFGAGRTPVILCGWVDTPLPDPRFGGITPCGACFLLLSAGYRHEPDGKNTILSLYEGALR